MSNDERQIVDVTYRNPQGEIVTTRYNGYPLMEGGGTLSIMDYGLVAAFAPGTWLLATVISPDEVDAA